MASEEVVFLLQELTDERASQNLDERLEEVLRDSSRPAEQGNRSDPDGACQSSVRLEPDRPGRRRRAKRQLADIPIGEAWHAVDAAVHVQHRWAVGWTCWICHRWSPNRLRTRCENLVEVSMSYVPGTVPREEFHWDRWRLVGPLGTRREEA